MSGGAYLCDISIPIHITDTLPHNRIRECLQSNTEECWKRVLDVFRRVIAATVIKVNRRLGTLKADEIDDLINDTFVRLCQNGCRILRQARSKEPEMFFGLVQAVATTTTLDHYRRAGAAKRGGSGLHVPLDHLEREAGGSGEERRLERALLIDRIDELIRQLGAGAEHERDRRIFWLHYRHGFTAAEIAALPNVRLSAKGVESALHRLTVAVRDSLGQSGAKAEGKNA